jgi:hypothetical protein
MTCLFLCSVENSPSFHTALNLPFRVFHRAQYSPRYLCVVLHSIFRRICAAPKGMNKQQLVLKCLGMHVFICIVLFLRYDQLPQHSTRDKYLYFSQKLFCICICTAVTYKAINCLHYDRVKIFNVLKHNFI